MDGIDVMHLSLVFGFAAIGALVKKRASTRSIILGGLTAAAVGVALGSVAFYILNGEL